MDETTTRSPKTAWWVLAYLVSPALPFICLRIGRAVGTVECVFGVLAGLVAHVGMVTVLVKTDGDPLQGFVVLLAGVSLFTVVMWQYLAGQRSNFWSEEAKRLWRFVGRFFGGLIGFATLLNIVVFHLVQRAR